MSCEPIPTFRLEEGFCHQLAPIWLQVPAGGVKTHYSFVVVTRSYQGFNLLDLFDDPSARAPHIHEQPSRRWGPHDIAETASPKIDEASRGEDPGDEHF